MNGFDVIVVGSLNLDLVATASRIAAPGETVHGSGYAEYAGGKGLNQAVAAARSGARVAMVGAVGDDAAGAELRRLLFDEGIDDSLVRTVAGVPTGRALITVADNGENSIVVVAGANAEAAVDELPPAGVLLTQLEVPIEVVTDAVTAGRAAGATTILNPAPARSLPVELLAQCDVVVPNEHEVDLIGGTDALRAAGVGAVIVTRGNRGVDVAADTAWHVAPFAVEPVDTTGAGDAFCGSLSARLARGDDLPAATHFAAAAGALATTRPGAVPSQPHAADTAALAATTAVAR